MNALPPPPPPPPPPHPHPPVPDHWSRVDDLFARVLELPPHLHHGFLEEECGGDLDLVRQVSELVTASERAAEELKRPGESLLRVAFVDSEDDVAPEDKWVGETVGPYRLTRELGRGGMATVFEAERVDGAFERRVAVKVLRDAAEPGKLAERFQAELHILSQLTHPNIARLLDAGTVRGGKPFLVMELVEGESITAWADRNRLSVHGRLEVLCQTARAVGFAHTHLIVHRDVKPSNVLVGHDGQVKLLDFGIAKLVEPQPAVVDALPTTRWMTPGYASPEQILGQPVTTATDVYGLGVLLYELLTGRRPFGEQGEIGFDLDRAVCETPPTRPSLAVLHNTDVAGRRGTTSDKLRRMLSGDLDAVIEKALRKEPSERYASAHELVSDLERHRAGLPVEARAGLGLYRMKNFVRRHMLGVATTAMIVVMLATSSLLLWRQQGRTAEAATRAAAEAENARLVIDFLADVFRGRDPEQAPADTLTARGLLAWGSERIETEFTAQPDLQAELFGVLGSAYGNLGLLDEAVAHHTRALDLARRVHGDQSSDVAQRLITLSQALRADRDPDSAAIFSREAVRIRRAGGVAVETISLGEALVELANAYAMGQQPDSAVSLLREALQIYDADSTRLSHTMTVLSLARARRAQGAYEDAARLYDEGIPSLRQLGEDGAPLAGALNNHAFLLRSLGEFERAAPLYEEGMMVYERLYGRGHPMTLLLANNLASVYHELGRDDEMLKLMKGNVEAARQQWPEGHWRTGAEHAALGRALLRTNHLDDGIEQLRQAHGVYSQTIGATHLWTYFVEATIAAAYIVTGRADVGQPYLDQFYTFRVGDLPEGRGTEDAGLINLLTPFVLVLQSLGLSEEAERFGELISPSAIQQ